MPKTPGSQSVDEYIGRCAPATRPILRKIRRIINSAAPRAEETISYRIPAFKLNGMLVYYAAFKRHIGLFPPVRGDARLMRAIAPYAGPKGNLRFPLDEPIPYALIERVVKARLRAMRDKAGARSRAGARRRAGARSRAGALTGR